jgi:hypothetical protein
VNAGAPRSIQLVVRLVLIAIVVVGCYTPPVYDYPMHPASAAGDEPVHVLGQVQRPASMRYVRGMTFTKAIAGAGGLTPFARTAVVRLTRGASVYRIPLADITAGSAPDPELAPGDTIVVPGGDD